MAIASCRLCHKYRLSFAVCRRVLGHEHLGTLTAVKKIALALCSQGSDADGAAMFREVTRMWILGPKRPHTFVSAENLAARDGELE